MKLDFATPAVKFRARAKLSQREAAKRIGITPVFLCEIEKGRKRPGWGTLLAMCEVYRTTPKAFLGG
jgi:DNA-binding XRE family transcriptional regulator